MKKEKIRKSGKRTTGRRHSLQYRIISFMCVILLVCSTVIFDTGLSRANSFEDEISLETEEGTDTVEAADDSEVNIDFSDEFSDTEEDLYVEGDEPEQNAGSGDSGADFSSEGTQAADLTYTTLINNDTVEVKAQAPAGSLPENAKLNVTPVQHETEQYTEVADKLAAQTQAKSQSMNGFLAYNVSFTDAEGNPVEPFDKVTYSFQYTNPVAPELTDPSNTAVTALKMKRNTETAELELVEMTAEANNLALEMSESRQLTKAAFQTAEAETVAIVWSTPVQAADDTNNGEVQEPEATPAPAPIGTVEITADEVNLRVAPSTEAEVLGTVNTGTQLPLLKTVTAEDTTTWYKVSYAETTAYIRSDMATVLNNQEEATEETPEEVPAEEAPAEITRYDYQSDEVNVKVTLTNPEDLPDNAELSVTPVELSQEAEEQITEEAIKESKAIESIRSYDIKFLVDGEEVQPGATVKVEVSFPNETAKEDAAVYHVDQDENVENMSGSINEEGNVEFETTHFSTYVIVNNKSGEDNNQIEVTVEHYDATATTPTKIYKDDTRTLKVGQRVDCKKATNWDIDHVTVNTNGTDTQVAEGDILLAQDATVKVYYTPTTGTLAGAPTFYDYTVKAGQSGNNYYSINQDDSYTNITEANKNQKITMGAKSHNYKNYQYTWKQGDYEVNKWTGSAAVVTGLLGEVSSDGTVNFNYPEPGFFVDSDKTVTVNGETRYLRQVYKNYTLEFTRSGDSYTLNQVKDGSGSVVTTAGADFFPLDTVAKSYEESDKTKQDGHLNDDTTVHNYFFGMRYDVKFTLGDYIGDLNYQFTGDDDLWAVLDGKVVVDLGGIHNAATGQVDLWTKLYNGEYANNRAALSEDKDRKNEEHTLTVLYLERGASASNCSMSFTLPNATISQVTTDELASLTFTKINKQQEGLAGATFGLYTDENCTTQIATAISGAEGVTRFNNLRPGTYYLKELQAPDNYVVSNVIWTVEVKGTTAVLKNSAGGAVEEIINETPEEVIKSSLEYNKTAKVKNWDQRTYDITITASSKSTSTVNITKKPVADIMLVLDVSGSMGDDSGSYTYVADNTSDGRSQLDTSTTYYVEIDGSYKKMSYEGRGWNRSWKINSKDASSNYENYKIYSRTRLDALKKSVEQFITDTAAKSPNSKIGITAFSSTGYGDHGESIELKKAGTDENALKNFVNALKANGGTDPATGLADAKSKLDAAGDTNPKYVILFTDGQPTGGGSTWDSTAQKNAEGQAEKLRTAGYTVYTIGFALDDRAKTFLAGGIYGNTNYPGIASAGCAKTADDTASLGEIFKEIQQSITNNLDITGATITDVIDSRFEIVDDGEVITEAKFTNGQYVLSSGGGIVTKLGNGNYQVQWTDQTIPNKNKEKDNQWSKTITVRAKDEYIGGNNVTTNAAGSQINTGYGHVDLPYPTVNVKSDLVVNNNEVTIFYGDTVPTDAEIINKLFNKSNPQGYVTQLDGSEKLVEYTMGADGQPFKETDFTLTWYEDAECTKLVDLASQTPAPESKEYYLKVTYNNLGDAKTGDECTTNTDENISGEFTENAGIKTATSTVTAHNSEDSKERKYGVYKINIIAGQIQIIKKLDSAAKEDATFTFDVLQGGKKIATATATVTAGATEAKVTYALEKNIDPQIKVDTKDSSILTGLPRGANGKGTYTITETPDANYTLKTAGIDEALTNCKSEVSDSKQITFTMGTMVDGKTEVLKNGNTDTTNGRVGVAVFTNEKTVADVELVKVDAADNNITIKGAEFALYEADENWNKAPENPIKSDIVSGNNGRITLEKIPVGNYLLYETKAATGYSLPTNPWRITIGNGGTVIVTDTNNQELAKIENTTIYKLTNTKVYSLPESGGRGIYGFTISGVAILTAALLLFINNKRKEDEARYNSTH